MALAVGIHIQFSINQVWESIVEIAKKAQCFDEKQAHCQKEEDCQCQSRT